MTTVADQMVDTLKAAGVQRIYGIVGDSLNGFTDSLRRKGGIDWLHVRHEEVAAFAAAGSGGKRRARLRLEDSHGRRPSLQFLCGTGRRGA